MVRLWRGLALLLIAAIILVIPSIAGPVNAQNDSDKQFEQIEQQAGELITATEGLIELDK